MENESREENKEAIMKKIEDETKERLCKLLKDKELDINKTANKLQNIMQKGADEFKKEMGRNMTYSEMRAMYG